MAKNKSFLIIGQPNCKWCEKAKALLLLHDELYDYISIGLTSVERNSTQAALVEWLSFNGLKTVPQIFHGTQYIGGFEELRAYLERS